MPNYIQGLSSNRAVNTLRLGYKMQAVILRHFEYIVTISFGYILHCVCFNLYCGGFILFCNVWVCVCVCVGFVMCGCFGNMYTVL
jgi:hypothetical protein